MTSKPYSEACARNQEPILTQLKPLLANTRRVLEIGSGSGQHGVYFARQLPQLIWQPSDLPEHLPGIEAWRTEAGLPNLLPPLSLDVDTPFWALEPVDAVFSANTAHILSWPQVEKFFVHVQRLLPPKGLVCLYGPFNYAGTYTSPSNAAFDEMLKRRNPLSAIRDFEAINKLATAAGLILLDDHPMPANNRLLVWRKLSQ